MLSFASVIYGTEAVFFKKRLTKEVYPELHKYLREREFAVVAHNLQCTWDECIPALALKAPRTMSSTCANFEGECSLTQLTSF
jgi:hypothetical protein